MALLKLLVSHLDAVGVQASLEHLELVAPGPVVVCHGGQRADFDALGDVPKLFLDDPGLRGPAATRQSYTTALVEAWRRWVQADATIDAVLVLEFDHVPLAPAFQDELLGLLDASGADMLGKDCADYTATNWWHRIRYRDDEALMAHLAGLSVRDDPTRLYGCLGTGFILRREALAAFAGVEHLPGIYVELYVPTVIHHLGFRVDNVDRLAALYDHVRWSPPYSLDEVRALQRAGATVVHPFKATGELHMLREA
ncbi:MAG: hypothetical protein QOF76_4203 [Solirubrobacteraceae bacterium]|nr:hypothetical protein [Solirubrobacteraceae bacterium]